MKTVHLGGTFATQPSHHGFVNAVHVVHVQLQLLERVVDRRGHFREALDLCNRAAFASEHPAEVLEHADVLGNLGLVVQHEVAEFARENAYADEATRKEITELVDILAKGLMVAELRIQQLLSHAQIDIRWTNVPVRDTIGRIEESLELLSLDPRWPVVYSRDHHDDQTHLVEIAVISRTGDHIQVPVGFCRLLAYQAYVAVQRTRAGGLISVAITDGDAGVFGSVKDNGRPLDLDGLPPRLRRISGTGDPSADAYQHFVVPLAVASVLVDRGHGSCDVVVSPSSETELRVSIPRPFGK